MPSQRRTALVTGASVGIGHELAKCFAADGFDVILVARDKERLDKVAAELQNQFRANSTVVQADLSQGSSPQAVFDAVGGREVEVLVNNAGFTTCGPFATSVLGDELDLLQVNMASLVALTRLFLPGMVERRSGRVWNVASVAAFSPGPFQATYYASKAFVLSFSEALHSEVSDSGVTVTAICPGPTQSEFGKRAGMKQSDFAAQFLMMTSADVARIGYDAGMLGKRKVVTGWRNKFIAFCMRRLMPGTVALWAINRLNRDRRIGA